MLLEKAFAKLAGCYDMLRGGLAYEALMDLTGCPTSSYGIGDMKSDELWALLEREDKNDNIMSASVTGVRRSHHWQEQRLAGKGFAAPSLSPYNISCPDRKTSGARWKDAMWAARAWCLATPTPCSRPNVRAPDRGSFACATRGARLNGRATIATSQRCGRKSRDSVATAKLKHFANGETVLCKPFVTTAVTPSSTHVLARSSPV